MTTRFHGFLLALPVLVAMTGPAYVQPAAADPAIACPAPSQFVQARFDLTRFEKALRGKEPVTILLLSGIKASTKADAPRRYGAYMEETLNRFYPDATIRVVSRGIAGATAEEAALSLPKLLDETLPRLVVWQTGTHDAIRGVDLDEFGTAVDAGIGFAHAAGADVVIVNTQYSPRTDFAFDMTPYDSTLRWAARRSGAAFFDRYGIMRYWAEEGVFALDDVKASTSLFEGDHRCLGHLLAEIIADGVNIKVLGIR